MPPEQIKRAFENMHAAADRTVEDTPVEPTEPAKKMIGAVKKSWIAVVAEKLEEKEEG